MKALPPPRKRVSLILVAASLLVPAFLLSLLGLKLLRDFTNVTKGFRSDYGEYMARVAASSIEDALWEQEQLNMVAMRLDPPRSPESVVRFLDEVRTSSPGPVDNPLYLLSFFVVPEGLVHYSELNPARTQEYRPLPSWILDPILETLEDPWTIPSGLLHLTSPDSLPPTQVTYFTVHSDEGELLGAAGFIWDLENLQEETSLLDRTLVLELGKNADVFREVFFESPVAITLLDETGTAFYSTSPEPTGDYLARKSFGRILPFYEVAIHLSNDRFDAWVGSVVRTHLAIILAMLLVIVLAVVFSFRFVFHEIELAELKSTLVSNVSHELKTPLALIRLFSETLELGRTQDPEKQKEFLRIIHKESERLTHLINNVLDVRRIEQGAKTYQMRSDDLARVVRETLDAYRYQLQQQGFDLESDVVDGLPPVHMDDEAIMQALLNLMDNAIKYSPERKFIRVDLHRRDGEAEILVEDHGVGISPRDQARIFEMFYRVERGLVHTVKGSGLGLSLVKHIVDAHGGRITVQSRPGEGSRFSIYLPLLGEGRKEAKTGDGPGPKDS